MAAYNLDEKGGLMGMFAIKSPSKIIKAGDVIEYKHYNLYEFIKATIVEVSDHSIRICSNSNNFDINAFPMDYIVVNFSQGEEVYVLSGEIAVIDKVDPFEFEMNVTKIDKLKDLRKNERFSVSLKAEIKLIGILDPKFAIVKNISLGGVKITTKEDIMMEDTIDLIIKLNSSNKISFKGKIVRKNKMTDFFEYGVEIIELSETNSKALHRFIYDL